jgi:hypothetical protein
VADDLPSPAGAALEPKVGHVPNLGFMRRNWRGPGGVGKTVIVTGIEPADGPLVIASVLRQLGVPVFFFPAGESVSSARRLLSPSGFRYAARKLSDQHATWAARVPFAGNMVSRAIDVVDNPHIIVVMEDLAATSIGRERSDKGPESALLEAAEGSIELAMFAARTRAPCLVMSLQKAREFARENVDAMAEFAGVDPPPETRLAATLVLDRGARSMRRPTVSRRAAQGALDSIQRPGGLIRGWAKFPLSGDRVGVRVMLEGEQIVEATCDVFREDLLPHSIGDGRHGLEVNVATYLADGRKKRFEVYALPELTLLGVVEISLEGGKAVG